VRPALVRPTVAGGLLILAAVGCDRPAATAPVTTASAPSLNVVAGNGQSAPVNTRLPQPVRVRVLDAQGGAVANFLLDFVVTSGGGSVFGGTETTNAQGYADEQWTLGPRLGPQTLEARAVNPATGVAASYGKFTANATPPNTVLVVGINARGIVLQNADGSNAKQLTTGGTDFNPDLSPNHSRIVFWSKRHADSMAVFMMNADGTNIHQISPTTYSYTDGGPRWSPDGSLVVFTGQPTSVTVSCPVCTQSEITVYVMDTLGTSYGQFVQGESFQGAASWLADQTGVLFATDALGPGGDDLYASSYSAGGSIHPGNYFASTAELTGGWDVGESADSPDGQHIAFGGCNQAAGGCGSDNLYVADPNGGHIVLVANNVGGISWSPDETLFAVNNGYINSDGTNYVAVHNCPCRFAWK
jgi:hypothetical protein